jgi:hypothetical protein
MRGIDLRKIPALDRTGLPHPGPAPQLDWLPIAKLVFDDSYQRPIKDNGIRHVQTIARQFDWRRFAPVIVAPVEGGRFAVIDGQHRTHAAALRGIETVPCQIVQADQKMQARAFAGMNGNQAIRLAPYQVHRAAVIARDVKALQVEHVCEQAGVHIAGNTPSDKMERGDTVAVNTIYRAIKDYGEPVVIAALEAIVKAGEGNVGLVNALAIRAYTLMFFRRPDLMQDDALLDALDDFDLATEINTACRAHIKQGDQRFALALALENFLSARLTPQATAA